MAAHIAKEKLELIEKCLDDGWPVMEIVRTHHTSQRTIERYFPGRALSKSEVGKLGALARKRQRILS